MHAFVVYACMYPLVRLLSVVMTEKVLLTYYVLSPDGFDGTCIKSLLNGSFLYHKTRPLYGRLWLLRRGKVVQ